MRTTYALLASLCLLSPSCGQSRVMQPMCPAGCLKCLPDATCHDCAPNQDICRGGAVVSCRPDGTIGDTVKTCDTDHNEMCADGKCLSPCDVAALSHSYIGCDYWPTTLLTPQLNSEFDFAVAVANPLVIGDVVQSAAAEITVTLGDTVIYDKKVVDPGDVAVLTLPWVPEVSQNGSVPTSTLSTDGAYHLVSSLPVTVYQFSPLQFERPATPTCKDAQPINNMCHSYTNDASILLPSTALRNDYIVISRGTFVVTDYKKVTNAIPGYFAVVGTQDNTVVTVKYTSNTPSALNIDSQKPGDVAKYTVDKGTVLQIISTMDLKPCVRSSTNNATQSSHCDLGPTYDLTGTRITSDKPIAVFGGHACAFVPYDKWACDHLEEQLFPLDTWGQTIAVAQTEPATQGEVNYWRVVSGSDNNMITFEPGTVQKPVTLNLGEWIEFPAQGGFVAVGTGRIAVAQYMVGENATMDFGVDVGDPALGLGIPVEQYRSNYDFLTPATYTKSYLNLIAPVEIDGVKVDPNFMLDGKALATLFTPIGTNPVDVADSTGKKTKVQFGYQRNEIQAGAHHITCDQKFSITVSGIANFTSYLYAGGLNLNDVPLQ